MTDEKLDDIHININGSELPVFNIETIVKAEYIEHKKSPLIKIIVDFYGDFKSEESKVFLRFEPDDIANIDLILFGNKTTLNNMILKKADAYIRAKGLSTYRMIFKNR